MAANNHLEIRVPIGEQVRDRLRDELGRYAYGATLLDGVTPEVHDRLVVNNPYYLEYGSAATSQQPVTNHDTLF